MLGSEQLQQLAQKAGLSPQDVLTHLAQLLPSLIDKLTPNGSLPAAGMLEEGISY